MAHDFLTRRNFLATTASTTVAAYGISAAGTVAYAASASAPSVVEQGSQRLSIAQLQKWESLRYGMFLHYGLATFVENEYPSGKESAKLYAPDKLDVDQWVSVARDAGMKYVVLTAKHVAGHCLWPSKHTDYTVANSTDKTNVVEKLCQACEKKGLLPGLYYNSSSNYDRYGSRMLFDEGVKSWGEMSNIPKPSERLNPVTPFTSSLYQTLMTAQITELLTQFGPIAEMWIDMPGILGRGYRTFLYHEMAELQPETVIMMNSGSSDFSENRAWPSDLISLEGNTPPKGFLKWRMIRGKKRYMPVEVCHKIGEKWFWFSDDAPCSDEALVKLYTSCRAGGANLLLNVPPDNHGLIPKESVESLMRLRKNVGI
ncbi:MAG: alpha-L-fucosidase [Kiritimatiellia bacterium]